MLCICEGTHTLRVFWLSLPSSVMDWLREHGLERPDDLRYAFSSEEEARRLAGDAVALLWVETQKAPEELPSTSQAWHAERIRLAKRAREREQPSQPRRAVHGEGVPSWKGLGSKAKLARSSMEVEGAARTAAARMVLGIALSWGTAGKLGAELAELPLEKRDE